MTQGQQKSQAEGEQPHTEQQYRQAEKKHMQHLIEKHPDCIPVFFTRHKEASSNLKQPTTPLILFKKDLKIQQAMYRLYEQVELKGLLFFCLNNNPNQKAKYIRLQPGPTIQQIYSRYGHNNFLLLIYADSEVGMQGLKKMEKCMIWVLIILGTIWAVLYGLSYYLESSPQAQEKNLPVQEWAEDIN